jgi:D-alanine transaminase
MNSPRLSLGTSAPATFELSALDNFSESNSYADWNGELMPLEEVRIPALDRGFLFADSVYEVLRVEQNQPLWFDQHLTRLSRSLDAVRMGCDLELVKLRISRLLQNHSFEHGFLYVQITRGIGPRKHAFPPSGTPNNILIFVQPFDHEGYQIKRNRGTAAMSHPDLRWKRPDIKSNNLLPNCLSIQAAMEQGFEEVILFNEHDEYTESPNANLFVIKDGVLITAPLGQDILHGITRNIVLRAATRLLMPVEERYIARNELSEIDEMFLTSTTCEVMPVVRVDDQIIGMGHPGKFSDELFQETRQLTRENLQPVHRKAA